MSGEIAPWYVGVTYLIYVLAYETLTLGGTAYAVFVLNHSGWWFVLGVVLSSGCFMPKRWRELWFSRRDNAPLQTPTSKPKDRP